MTVVVVVIAVVDDGEWCSQQLCQHKHLYSREHVVSWVGWSLG